MRKEEEQRQAVLAKAREIEEARRVEEEAKRKAEEEARRKVLVYVCCQRISFSYSNCYNMHLEKDIIQSVTQATRKKKMYEFLNMLISVQEVIALILPKTRGSSIDQKVN